MVVFVLAAYLFAIHARGSTDLGYSIDVIGIIGDLGRECVAKRDHRVDAPRAGSQRGVALLERAGAGFAATGVGVVIGLSIGLAGRGIAMKFGILAAVYTIIGCVFGNLIWAAIELAPASATSPIDVLQNTAIPALVERSTYYIFSIALIYWFVAVVAAVFLARRALSRTQRLALGLLEMRG